MTIECGSLQGSVVDPAQLAACEVAVALPKLVGCKLNFSTFWVLIR